MEAIKNQEEIDMCEALQGIFDDGKEEGEKIGRQEGEKIGRLELLFELVKDGVLDISQAAAKAGKTEAEFKELLK